VQSVQKPFVHTLKMNIDKSLQHYRDRLIVLILKGSDTSPRQWTKKKTDKLLHPSNPKF
jgi:hypothetical protein